MSARSGKSLKSSGSSKVLRRVPVKRERFQLVAKFQTHGYKEDIDYIPELHKDKPNLKSLNFEPKYRQDSVLKQRSFVSPAKRPVRRPLKAYALSQAEVGVEASFANMKESPKSSHHK